MGTWTADTENQFAGMSVEEMKRYVGTYILNDNEVVPETNPELP